MDCLESLTKTNKIVSLEDFFFRRFSNVWMKMIGFRDGRQNSAKIREENQNKDQSRFHSSFHWKVLKKFLISKFFSRRIIIESKFVHFNQSSLTISLFWLVSIIFSIFHFDYWMKNFKKKKSFRGKIEKILKTKFNLFRAISISFEAIENFFQ